MSLKRSSSVRLKKFVLASVLAAVILLMWLVPFIGYIKVGVIEITLLMIPVAVGAITLGPSYGAVLGGVFGLTSVLMAFLGVPSPSAFGTALVVGIVFGIYPALKAASRNPIDSLKHYR